MRDKVKDDKEKKKLSPSKDIFFNLLKKSTKPHSEEDDQRKESQKHGDYTAKRTRQRKVEGASD